MKFSALKEDLLRCGTDSTIFGKYERDDAHSLGDQDRRWAGRVGLTLNRSGILHHHQLFSKCGAGRGMCGEV